MKRLDHYIVGTPGMISRGTSTLVKGDIRPMVNGKSILKVEPKDENGEERR